MALYVSDLADFCKAYIFSRKLSLIGKTLIMMTLGKYILKKVVDVCECFEISWVEQFAIDQQCCCVTSYGRVLLPALVFGLGPEGSKGSRGNLSPLLWRAHWGRKICYAYKKNKLKKCWNHCLIVCLITWLNRLEVCTDMPCIPFSCVPRLSLENSCSMASLGGLMSCQILPCLVYCV